MIQTNPHGNGFIDTATGRRFVPVGTNYAAMLDMVDYRGQPRRFDLGMKRMFTDDRYHETWWNDMIRDYPASGPLDFRYLFERKPMTDWPNDIHSLDIISQQKDAWAQ